MSAALAKPDAPPPPDANLGYLVRLGYQGFRQTLDDALRDLELSAQDYGILSVFETRPELSTAELARIAQVTRQTMHTAVLRLEHEGLLQRRRENQRVVLLRPTRRGRARLKAATRRVRAVENDALGNLTAADEQLIRTWLLQLANPRPYQQRRSIDAGRRRNPTDSVDDGGPSPSRA
jgi:DNA-binding MarR family transcriptional regulator